MLAVSGGTPSLPVIDGDFPVKSVIAFFDLGVVPKASVTCKSGILKVLSVTGVLLVVAMIFPLYFTRILALNPSPARRRINVKSRGQFHLRGLGSFGIGDNILGVCCCFL